MRLLIVAAAHEQHGCRRRFAKQLLQVVDEIAAFRQTVGDFGTLLYAGKDWTDPALARRSMVLLKEQVLPKL